MRASAIAIACILAVPVGLAPLSGSHARDAPAPDDPWARLEEAVRAQTGFDPSGMHAVRFRLPVGHVLEGSFEDGVLLLTSEPAIPRVEQLERQDPLGPDCVNDVPSTGHWHSVFQVAKRTMAGVDRSERGGGLRFENRASQGECPPGEHEGPVHAFQFYTEGDRFGGTRVEDASGGVFAIWCEGRSAATGVGAGTRDDWTTEWRGVREVSLDGLLDVMGNTDRPCGMYSEPAGFYPNDFTRWLGTSENGHWGREGVTYAAFPVFTPAPSVQADGG